MELAALSDEQRVTGCDSYRFPVQDHVQDAALKHEELIGGDPFGPLCARTDLKGPRSHGRVAMEQLLDNLAVADLMLLSITKPHHEHECRRHRSEKLSSCVQGAGHPLKARVRQADL